MPEVQVHAPTSVSMSQSAAARLQELLLERNLEGHAIRVMASGCRCSGLHFEMAFENRTHTGDQRFSIEQVDLVIDPRSLAYLSGAVIDYVGDSPEGDFFIEAPQAMEACGCGHGEEHGASPGHHHQGHHQCTCGAHG